MTTSAELMYAILAMDSYNRGYNEGIEGFGGEGTLIGNYEITDQSDIVDGSDGVNAGFYAIAYSYSGETVISYRGTEQNFSLPWDDVGSDLWNGYGSGAGNPINVQSNLAVEFYQAVTGIRGQYIYMYKGTV